MFYLLTSHMSRADGGNQQLYLRDCKRFECAAGFIMACVRPLQLYSSIYLEVSVESKLHLMQIRLILVKFVIDSPVQSLWTDWTPLLYGGFF